MGELPSVYKDAATGAILTPFTRDLIDDFSVTASPLQVINGTIMPVRHARFLERAQSGEMLHPSQVAILDPNAPNGKPLYGICAHEFCRIATPALGVGNLSNSEVTKWYIGTDPRPAYLIDESHGPFHLDAPASWNCTHAGWDVDHVTHLQSEDGRIMRGYLLIATPAGLIFDNYATRKDQYRLQRQPEAALAA